jgi:predicted transcriptional regulator
LKHRSKIEIIADILENIRNDGNMSTSKIIYKTFISYNQAKEYIPLLLQTELIKHGNNEHTFMITNKGLHFLNTYNMLPKYFGKDQ